MNDPVIASAIPVAPTADRPAPPKPAPAVLAAPVRWGFVVAWAVAAFALLLAAFAWLPWLYPQAGSMTPFGQTSSHVQQPPVTAEPPANSDRVKALEEKLAALSAQLADQSALAATDAATQKEVLEKTASAIKADSIQAATQAAAQTATAVAGEAASTAAHTAAISAVAPLLAAARLEDRLARGAAYQAELASLLPILTEGEKADLSPLAGGGPDTAALAAQLDAKQRGLLAVYRESMASSWLEKIRARLSGIITITAPDNAPDAASAAYAKLRAQLVQDDAAGAIATLRMLPQTMQDGLQSVDTALTTRAKAKAALTGAIARLTAPAAEAKPN